jgi:hypothetical protein
MAASTTPLRHYAQWGAKTVGAGRTPAEAWEPAVIDVAGHTVAFVAAASVFRVGYEAKGPRGGIAALAAVDHYAPRFPAAYVPGVPPPNHLGRKQGRVAAARNRN